jgi:hypothetical protein
MKKYLIKGLLALVAGGFAASCADKDVDYVPLAQQKSQAYEKAFEEMIGGKVDPNQDWGFESIALPEEDAATRAMTRNNGIDGAINVNGNEWTECPGVTIPDEVNKIFEYVKNGTTWMRNNNKPFATTHPENLNGYFVTQVRSGANNYADNTYTNTYNNNAQVTNVGNWMNHLQIAFNQNPRMSDLNNANEGNGYNASGWEHINNFNGSKNVDYGFVTSPGNGNTKVEGKGAYDFAYYNSLDSKYHNKWILVDGANISSDGAYANYYYVCFDFESTPTNNTTRYSYYDNTQGNGGFNGQLSGTYYTSEEVLAALKSQGITDRSNIQITGWEQQDKMIPGDNVYSDWIIRITKGSSTTPGTNPGTTPPPSETTTTTTQHIKKKVLVVQGRVFCEDLGTAGRKDIDFNDIVFDARIWYTFEFDRVTTGSNTEDKNYSAGKYEAEICLLAAGGTIPVKLAERNVHDIFQPAAGLTTMVNTVDDHADIGITWENSSAERDPVTFTYDMTTIVNQKGTISLNDIPLEVLWTMGSSDDPSSGYGTMQSVGVLNANLGQVPHKICLPIGTVWPSERRSMDGAYKYFATWAMDKNSYPEFYKNEGDQVATDSLYTGKTTGLSLTDANGREYYTTNDGSIWTNYSAEEIRSSSSYSVIETTLWEGSQTYAPEASNNNLTIASVTFNVGDKFRVYGTNGSGSERWITFHDADANGSNWQAIVSAGPDFSVKGYHSIEVDSQDKASRLSNGPKLYIAGKDMTITKITKVSTSSN